MVTSSLCGQPPNLLAFTTIHFTFPSVRIGDMDHSLRTILQLWTRFYVLILSCPTMLILPSLLWTLSKRKKKKTYIFGYLQVYKETSHFSDLDHVFILPFKIKFNEWFDKVVFSTSNILFISILFFLSFSVLKHLEKKIFYINYIVTLLLRIVSMFLIPSLIRISKFIF